MTPLDFASAPIRMVDVRHPDGRFPPARRWFDRMFRVDYSEVARLRSRRNRWALYQWQAADDFEAIGDDRSAMALRGLAQDAMQ